MVLRGGRDRQSAAHCQHGPPWSQPAKRSGLLGSPNSLLQGVPTTPQPKSPLSQLGWGHWSPAAPSKQAAHSQGGLSTPYLRPVELQIWVLLPFQVSIAQETAVLKCTAPLSLA